MLVLALGILAGTLHGADVQITSGTIAVLCLIGLGWDFYWHRSSASPKASDEPLPFIPRLQLLLSSGRAIWGQMDDLHPSATLKPASVWRKEVHEALHRERPDLAERFLQETEDVAHATDHSLGLNPSKFLMEEQIGWLQETIREMESARSLSAARKRGSPALGQS